MLLQGMCWCCPARFRAVPPHLAELLIVPRFMPISLASLARRRQRLQVGLEVPERDVWAHVPWREGQSFCGSLHRAGAHVPVLQKVGYACMQFCLFSPAGVLRQHDATGRLACRYVPVGIDVSSGLHCQLHVGRTDGCVLRQCAHHDFWLLVCVSYISAPILVCIFRAILFGQITAKTLCAGNALGGCWHGCSCKALA